jgi:tetratricopeptide (TPR) repeat protein
MVRCARFIFSVGLIGLTLTSSSITAQTDAAEARRHYKVGLVALENNDLVVAAEEFREAVTLAPRDALMNYNLAVVLSKQDKPEEALTSLRTAMKLDLPAKEAGEAEDLEAKLTYALKRRQSLNVNWMAGVWSTETSQQSSSDRGDCYKTVVRRWTLELRPSGSDGNFKGFTHILPAGQLAIRWHQSRGRNKLRPGSFRDYRQVGGGCSGG